MSPRLLGLAGLLLLAGCGEGGNEAGTGGVTASEARELNQAAAMLDENSVSANAVGADGEGQP